MRTSRFGFTALVCMMITGAQAQGGLRVEDCQQMAMKNHPWRSQSSYFESIEALNIKTASNTWLPSITLNGQATWQSDVTKINLDMPQNSPLKLDIPSPSHQQYKATVDIRQNIYDGGLSRAKKNMEQADVLVNTQQVTTEIEKVKDLVNRLFFAALVNDRLMNQLDNSAQTLMKRRDVVASAVRNGVSLQADLDALDAEILSLVQKMNELAFTRASALENLALVTGDSSISGQRELVEPSFSLAMSDSVGRQELVLLDMQGKKIDASAGALSVANRPRVFAFSSLGYGNPGLNMFKTGWQPFAIVGLGVSWPITDWGKTRRDKQVMSMQKLVIETKRNDLVRSVKVAMATQHAEVAKYQSHIETDQKLIDLRVKISRTADLQQQAGTITMLDYLTQLAKERDARIALEIHKVMLQKALADYRFVAGN